MVRLHPDPPLAITPTHGAIAQLGERLLCKQEVTGSIPVGSTSKGISNQCRAAMLIGASSSIESIGCSLTIWD